MRAAAGFSATKARKARRPAAMRSTHSSPASTQASSIRAATSVDGGVEGAEEDLFLAVEVVVERFAGNPGTPNDVGDLGRLVALFRGQLRHRIHDAATLTHCDELSWKLGPSRLHRGSPAWGWEHG